jgi:hypothetical protein
MSGEISTVHIEAAGLGTKRVLLVNLPLELPDSVIRIMISRFGDIMYVLSEIWSTAYRYPVANGIKIIVITLRTHVPSKIVVEGHRAMPIMKGNLRHVTDVTNGWGREKRR